MAVDDTRERNNWIRWGIPLMAAATFTLIGWASNWTTYGYRITAQHDEFEAYKIAAEARFLELQKKMNDHISDRSDVEQILTRLLRIERNQALLICKAGSESAECREAMIAIGGTR